MSNRQPDTSLTNERESAKSGFPPEQRAGYAELGQPASRRPWKGIQKIAGFFALVGILSILLNAAINFGLRRITVSKFGALNQEMFGKVNADIIINGSSRALCHYDPRIIENATGRSAYNIGMNASQIDFELVILKTYLNHNTKPKLVIQNLDLFSFETTKRGELYDPGYYLPYLHDHELYGFFRQKVPDAWKCKYIPLYGYAVEDMRFTWFWGLLGCFRIHGPQDYYLGFNPRAVQWNHDFGDFKMESTNGIHYAIESEGVQSLEEVINLCHQNGINIILVYSPEYYEVQELETNRREIMDKFREISEKFKVPLLDYSDSILSQQQENFNNSEHLNQKGAELFSEDLSRRLVDEFPEFYGSENTNAAVSFH